MAPSKKQLLIKPRWIRAKDVCRLLSMDSVTLYRHAKAGRIPSARIGRTLRFDLYAIEATLEEARKVRLAEGKAREKAKAASRPEAAAATK